MFLRIARCCQKLQTMAAPRYEVKNARFFANTTLCRTNFIANQQFEMMCSFKHSEQSSVGEGEFLTFEEFKQKKVGSFEEFKRDVQSICNSESELRKAYEGFCRSEYAWYKIIKQGGNPALMI